MAAPPPSRLDGNQVLQGSFDEATGRLRTDANATIVNADIDVSLDASEDNVAIADPDGDFLQINPDGSINVVFNPGSGSVLSSEYSEVTGIVAAVVTLIGSFTASSPNTYLQKIDFSGTNIAEYELRVNSVTEDKKRTYFGNSLNGSFDFNAGLLIPSGDTVEVYVVHNRPNTGDFNIRIQTLES